MTTQKHNFKYIFFFLMLFLFSVKGLAANYYWVGGSGNWSDINHWRTTSGGTGVPSVVPGPVDNVFFDGNSGFTGTSKTITMNVDANCRNITFSGSATAPVIKGNSKSLNIYGSSEWQSGMMLSITSIYYRNTNALKTIKSNGVLTESSVYFEEETSIDLLDDFSSSSVNHTAGTFNTHNYTVKIFGYYGNSGTKPRVINMGSSDFYVQGSFKANSLSLSINAGTSHLHLSGNSPSLSPYTGQVYYNVSFEGDNAGSLGDQQTGTVYYNRVEFKNTGKLVKDNQIKELILAAGKAYTLESSRNQIITSSLKASAPDCGDWITINASGIGTKAKLVAAPGVSIDVSRVILKDIEASGGAVFTAVQSTDDGNNTGWNFPASSNQNLYWVGGSGDWSDKTHWSQTSGGSGGYCIPGPSDNVFFNGHSGFTASDKTITLSSVAYSRDITFSGSVVPPVLQGNGTGKILNIYGSSEWQAGMIISLNSSSLYYRNTNTAKTIKSNGVSLLKGMEIILEEETSIDLLDDFSGGSIMHSAGTFTTHNYTVKISSYRGNLGLEARVINMGSSDFYLTSGFSASSSALTLNSGTSHIYFSGTSSQLNCYDGQVYYNVTFESTQSKLGNWHTGTVYYNQVEFKSNGEILGQNQIKELILTAGKTYTLESGQKQIITSSLKASSPDCGDWITINASVSGTQAKLMAAIGVSIDVSRAILKDIQASGGAIFSALQSIDNGNNTGWSFPASAVRNLYWVGGSGDWNDKVHWSQTSGGSGGYCIPGTTDNVFFDENSGFTTSDKTIILPAVAYSRDITFSGSAVPPVLKGNGNGKILNIYGSSEWQSGMVISLNFSSLYYRNTNTAKTIKSNGVSFLNNLNIYFEEETSVDLLDDFSGGGVYHTAGTLNTNNYTVKISSYRGNLGLEARVINMGSSDFYLDYDFNASSPLLTLNSETSHIHFSGNQPTLKPYAGQIYYNISFEATKGILGNNQSAAVYYNRVEFKGNGDLVKENQIKELILTAGKTYTLDAGSTQTVTDQLYASGNSCFILFLKSSATGTKANLNIMADFVNFDFVNAKDINASGKVLNFGSKSTNAGNNSNMTFETYNPSAFSGFEGQNWSAAKFKDNDPSSYMLSSAGFYGTPYTTYQWSKMNDPVHTGTIGTGPALDMRPFGYGTYHVKVEYSAPGSPDYCMVEESILVKSFVPSMINPGLPVRNY
ncbi:hypothetical protein [Chryseobacterium vrystaatense]|uniref:Uncharacterized protein n=1 Tax=Chryseobacterium vrystaatense TaxID=307480 RepID=A0ABR4UIR0_9FLAO|nr:hypothetical protein [Chryseobacterium vrystaatense]KFF24583.1 hypothetical protein IW16_19900 [Chryseobacterium vrystaatense]